MKIFKVSLLISSIVILANSPSSAYCSSHWDDFLIQPNNEALNTLSRTINASIERCSPEIAPAQRHRTQLFKLISGGEPSAFKAGLLVSKCWDGGELEDFHRSAGSFFELHPRIFLQQVTDAAIPATQVKRMLTMLPLDTVDNIDLRISTVERRVDILKGIHNESFDEVMMNGILDLEQYKRSLIRTKSELEKLK